MNLLSRHTLFILSIILAFGCENTKKRSEIEVKGEKISIGYSEAVRRSSIFLKIAGSNTLGDQVVPELASNFLSSQLMARNVTIIESDDNSEKLVVGIVIDSLRAIHIVAHGSSTAFDSLNSGWSDIGMTSRPIKAQEAKRLQKLGDFTKPNSEFVIALDGIAIIVHPENQISHLPLSTISEIFSGKVKKWEELNNEDKGEINLYSRDTKSGTYNTFQDLILNQFNVGISAKAEMYDTNEKVSKAVSKDKSGIGFASFSEIENAKALEIDEGAIALAPTKFNLASEDYPLTRRLYFYVPEKPLNPFTDMFVDFVMSDIGQKVVGQTNLVSQIITDELPEIPENSPKSYSRTVHRKRRLSVNIRFNENSTEFDNKAGIDIRRIANFANRPSHNVTEVYLLGFADSKENDLQWLSEQRAKVVSDALKEFGVKSVNYGFGDQILLSSSDESISRNRRVEVWIKAEATTGVIYR